jgi:PBS lyase HEAT-like repeat
MVGRVGVALLLAALVGAATRAQLQGHISMAKDVYFAGEPVYVLFEYTNVGKDAVQYSAGDPYAEGCGGYKLEVSEDGAKEHASCGERGAGLECIVGSEILAAGETRHQLILVNFGHDLSQAGKYQIHATQEMKYAVATGDVKLAAAQLQFKVEQRFTMQVMKADRERLVGIYKPYVVNLNSQDDEIQREAERAIVSGAPPWLEDTIVGMLRRYTSREFALLGLKNLNTARSREELAKIVQNTSENTEENLTAVRYLAELGDKRYFPMLLEIAKKQPANEGREYVLAAAELGGDESVMFLQEMLGSGDGSARANAVMGLGKTGSRAAVPLLIEVLNDRELGKLAGQGLVELTHRQEGDWSRWWAANAGNAAVFGVGECGW